MSAHTSLSADTSDVDVRARSRTEEALRRQNAYLEMLHETTLGLVNRLDLNDLLESIVVRAASLLGTADGYLYLVEPDRQSIQVQYASGIFTSFMGFRMARGEGIGGKVWESGDPLVIDDYDQWAGRSPNFPRDVLCSVAGVPLKSDGDVVGVIGVAYPPPMHVFNDDEVKVLNQFAHLASIVLDNARLYASAQQEIAERNRTSEALRQSEERYRTIIESIDDGYYETDLKGRFTFINEAVTTIVGSPRDQIIGSDYRDFGDIEEAERVFSVFNSVYVTGKPSRAVDVKINLERGGWRYVELSASLMRDSNGEPCGFRGIVRDVSDRKAIEQALQASEARYRSVIASMAEGVMLFDSQGVITAINDRARDILRMSDAQLLGKTPAALDARTIHEDGTPFPAHQHPAMMTLRTGEPQLDVVMGIREGNEVVSWISINSRAIHHEGDDAPTAVVASFSDITKRKLAELELYKRVQMLAELQEVNTKLTQSLDIHYVLYVALDSMMRASGADAGVVALIDNDQIAFINTSPNYPQPSEDAKVSIETGIVGRVIRTRRSALIPDVTKDPDYVAVIPTTRAQITMPLMSHDTLVGVVLLETARQDRFTPEVFYFLELVTARIAVALDNARLYEVAQTHLTELQKLYSQVSELEQLKTHMIRVAAHDIRSPLGVVTGYLSLIEDDLGADNAQYAPYFDAIKRAVQRMQRMSTDVLSLERIHVAQEKEWLPLSLRETIERAFIDQRGHANMKAILLTAALPDDPVMLAGDPVQLYEAAVNLIGNALKYTGTNGDVRVSLRVEDEQAVFEVVDNGMGVPEYYHDKLFQPFYRVKTEATRSIDGTGLGLYLVRSIVERHGGTMRFHSVEGEGSTFGFALPL